MSEAIKKIYPHNHEATLVCEQCGAAKKIDTTPYEGATKPLRVRCGGCGFRFLISIETRKFYRKPTRLQGKFVKVGAEDVAGMITVRNLSRTGLQFEVYVQKDICPGDMLRVTFALDNKERTEIRKRVVVRSVQERLIGAEFCDLDPYESRLGFYLMHE